MIAKYKCDFCGAPRIRTDYSCQFCGQVFNEKNIEFKNINLKNLNKEIKFIKNFKNSIDFSSLIKVTSAIKKGFVDSSKKTILIFNKTEKRSRNFIFNNSKLILVAFAGLTFWIITFQVLTNYLNYIAAEEERIALENARAEEKKIAFDNRNKKDQYNRRAEEKFKNNDFEDALNNYYESLKIAPNYREHIWFIKANNKALKGIAEIKILQRKYYDAIRNFSEIIDRGNSINRKFGEQSESELAEIYYKRGSAYHALKEYELAKNDFSLALSLVKTNPMPKKNNDFTEQEQTIFWVNMTNLFLMLQSR